MPKPASDRLRQELVAQLRARGVIRSDAVAAAFLEVPREQFIPDVLAEQGLEAVYRDRAFPIKHDGRGMPLSSSSQPAIMAEMLELLDARPGQRVLEVGAGTGYNAALLSRLVGSEGRVTTIDIDPAIARRARRALRGGDGYPVRVEHGDGRIGPGDGRPFDRIIVTASTAALHRPWLEQLTERGRIVVPLALDRDADAVQLIPVLERRGRQLRSLDMTWGGFMPLHGGDGGYQAPPASLNANRHWRGGYSSYVSVSGAPIARLSDGAARRLLSSMLAPERAQRHGWSPLARGHTPVVLDYLLATIPPGRRVWLRQPGRHGIGMIDARGGLAAVTVRSLWETGSDRDSTRARWRLHCWGRGDRVCETLGRMLERWRALERSGPHQSEIIARPGGEAMRISLLWRPVRSAQASDASASQKRSASSRVV